jgi:O-antigen ligase
MAFATDEEAAGSRERLSSNLYRKVEDYNLAQMSRKNPILGIGFGVPLDYSFQPMPIFWDLGLFIPHNEILGVAAKMGFIGYVAFWFFYLSVLVEIAKGFMASKDSYHKAVLVMVMAAVINHIVYSFFDITLTYYRNNVFVGTLLGIAAVIVKIDKQAPEAPAATQARATPPRPDVHWIVRNEETRVTA